jgi:hypothetical protein
MRQTRLVTTAMMAALVLALMAAPGLAAHNGNNRADLEGEDVTGRAVLNYTEGQGTFSGTLHALGLPSGSYAYQVSLNGTNPQTICTFTVGVGVGRQGCSAQHLELGGFTRAEIATSDGTVVASGVFDRAGNCRDPLQGGSQCEAPGRT